MKNDFNTAILVTTNISDFSEIEKLRMASIKTFVKHSLPLYNHDIISVVKMSL